MDIPRIAETERSIGCWSKSDVLFRAIRSATLENLILAGSLKEEIRDDLARFFATRGTYESHGVP
jgi:hypothetical protein